MSRVNSYDYMVLPKEKSASLRNRFIDEFVDVNAENYIKYIKPLKADDVWEGYGHCMYFLWCCLKNKKLSSLSAIKAHLSSLGDKEIYVMFDIYPKEHILPDGYDSIYPPHTKLFPSDSVLKMNADEFLKVITNDLENNESDVYNQFFGEDFYAFDESFKWYIATTHEFLDDEGTQRICYSNIQTEY